MATNIKLKYSSVTGKTPTLSDLDLRELAVNTADGKLFLRKGDGSGTDTIRDLSDHGSMDGLGGDDHSQYIHTTTTRTGVTAEFNTTGKITTTNNIGVGTTNPTQKLDVNGNIRLRGALYDNSNGIGIINQVLTSTGSGISWQDAAVSGVGIQSGGTTIGTGVTTLNFIDTGSTFTLNGNTVDISIFTGTTRTVNTYTATSGQTTFSATYDVGYVDVFLNGAKLSENEYTATNGTSIVLDTGASLNDIVEIVGYSNINIAGGSATPDISPVMMGMIF